MSLMQKIMAAIRGHCRRPPAAKTPEATAAPGIGVGLAESEMTLEQEVDVFLTEKVVAKLPEILDWKHSIVDLLKVLDEDSSLEARKDLAAELGFEGEFTGTDQQNTWLHVQVMQGVMEGEFAD